MGSCVMSELEKRLVVLEQAARLLAARPIQHISSASIDEIQRRFTEILTRPRPEKTLEEIRDEFRVHAARLRADFERRHGNL